MKWGATTEYSFAVCVCVCLCECVQEREGEKERKLWKALHRGLIMKSQSKENPISLTGAITYIFFSFCTKQLKNIHCKV